MNLGLGNLTDLKSSLLPSANQADTQWDDLLAEIGSGVAGLFADTCRRQWLRTVGDTFEFTADRGAVVLPRYPVESITSIEQRDSVADDWQTLVLNEVVWNRLDRAGILEFGFVLGDHRSLIRVTYTGGYWYDTSEDGSGTLPAGATPLPGSLRHAWLLQCRHVFEQIDAMEARTLGDKKVAIPEVTIQPVVMELLRPFIRFA